MRGTVLISNPPNFLTFELAHRIQAGAHGFEIAYGSSFNELYYDFSPTEFMRSPDRQELELQLGRAGQSWLLPVLHGLATGALQLTPEELVGMSKEVAK